MSLYLPLVKPHLVLAVQVGAEACLPWESRSGKTTAGVDLVLRVIFLRERPAAGGLPCRRRRLGGRGGERGGREPNRQDLRFGDGGASAGFGDASAGGWVGWGEAGREGRLG